MGISIFLGLKTYNEVLSSSFPLALRSSVTAEPAPKTVPPTRDLTTDEAECRMLSDTLLLLVCWSAPEQTLPPKYPLSSPI